MGLFDSFKKKKLPEVNAADDDIVAMADGNLIDVTTVSDPVFAQKMMGDSIAFTYEGDKVTVCSPANGTLSVLFPTGHAFGITMKDGTELLVHIGINTVEAKGDGMKVQDGHKQGDTVKAGDPIVEVDLKKLRSKYDMSTMLIVTNDAGKKRNFIAPQKVERGSKVTD
jgi:PTS system glucose-specific IIA component